MTISKKIFAQRKPDPLTPEDLYVVPSSPTSQAKGTIYISQQKGSHDKDYIWVQLIPATLQNNSIPVTADNANTYIMSSTMFYGQVSIYLQQICLNAGDAIRVSSQYGTCAFTYMGELYTN